MCSMMVIFPGGVSIYEVCRISSSLYKVADQLTTGLALCLAARYPRVGDINLCSSERPVFIFPD